MNRAVAFGLAVIVFAVWVTARQARGDIRDSQKAGCVRGLLERADAISSDGDIADFALRAAQARNDAGDFDVARAYLRIEDRASTRQASRRDRLLGANEQTLMRRDGLGHPSSAAQAEARRACDRAL